MRTATIERVRAAQIERKMNRKRTEKDTGSVRVDLRPACIGFSTHPSPHAYPAHAPSKIAHVPFRIIFLALALHSTSSTTNLHIAEDIMYINASKLVAMMPSTTIAMMALFWIVLWFSFVIQLQSR